MSDQQWSLPGQPGEPQQPGRLGDPQPEGHRQPRGGGPVTPLPQGQQPPGTPRPDGLPYAGGGQVPRPEFRPGIVPLRPLLVGEIYAGTFQAMRANPGAVFGLATVTSLIFIVPFTALAAFTSMTLDLDGEYLDPDQVYNSLAANLPSIGSALSTILLSGFVAWVIGQAILGKKVSASQCWKGTRPYLWRLIAATLLMVAASVLAAAVLLGIPIGIAVLAMDSSIGIGLAVAGFILAIVICLVLSAWLWVRLAFVTPIIVLERTRVISAFRRSWKLTGDGAFWRIFGVRLLTAIGTSVIAFTIGVPLAALAAALPALGTPADQAFAAQAVMAGLTTIVAGIVVTPINAGVDSLLYIDQRMRREGLDIELMNAVQNQAGAPGVEARN